MADQEETIQISKTTLWKGFTFVFAALFVISIFTQGFGYGSDNQVTGGAAVNVPTAQFPGIPEPTAVVEVSLDGAGIKGDEKAPVIILEYSDFECPFCERFFSQTASQIDEKYVKTGKVKFAYKHYPLPFHTTADEAAIASECAKEQGKFWEMHDALFKNRDWVGQTDPNIMFKKYAKDLKFKTSQFDKCVDDRKYEDLVQKQTNEGSGYGVQGTPAFFVNGKLISGAQPFQAFQAAIEAEL